MPTEEVDVDAAIRQELLTVTYCLSSCYTRTECRQAGAEIAAAAFEEAPPKVQERIKQITSLVNFPSIGVANNYVYAMAQVNVASAKRPTTKTGRGHKGRFVGGPRLHKLKSTQEKCHLSQGTWGSSVVRITTTETGSAIIPI
jgi:adenine deaminase